MKMKTTLLLLSGAIGMCLSGCAATSPVMRGQSFDGGYGMMGDCQSCDAGYGGDVFGQEIDITNMKRRELRKLGIDKPGRNRNAHAAAPADQCLNVPFHPVHRNFHTYDVPNGLSYPEEQTATAAVQYPYYTFRGPTDFFMQ